MPACDAVGSPTHNHSLPFPQAGHLPTVQKHLQHATMLWSYCSALRSSTSRGTGVAPELRRARSDRTDVPYP
jgi:hypothetical protein